MLDYIYRIIYWIADVHYQILTWNDTQDVPFTDKQLHFIVIGLLGLAMVFVVHPIFKLLAESGHTMVITWIYVFTLIIVMTLAIELGQGFTGTGVMDFNDTISGVGGFLVMFAIFAVIRAIVLWIYGKIKNRSKHGRSKSKSNR